MDTYTLNPPQSKAIQWDGTNTAQIQTLLNLRFDDPVYLLSVDPGSGHLVSNLGGYEIPPNGWLVSSPFYTAEQDIYWGQCLDNATFTVQYTLNS